MARKTWKLRLAMATVLTVVIYHFATTKFYEQINDFIPHSSRTRNLRDPPTFESNIVKTRPNVSIENPKMKREHQSTNLHTFKSKYIIDPIIYDNDAIHRAPGKRKIKIISCFNCAYWFFTSDEFGPEIKDFTKCAYSECRFDNKGVEQDKADLLIFFPVPQRLPSRPPGQIWAYFSWESPFHYGYPSPYSQWKYAFNWTMSFRQDADLFVPYRRLAWRARDNLMNDSEYQKIASLKTKTAVWFVSNCKTPSRRQEYVKRMQKIIDIDIYGGCSEKKCNDQECSKKLNDTYKFYLSFENSFCKDYVTEKLFKIFQNRLQIIPVARGGFDYQKHIPPNMIVDASQFDNPEALAKHLKELGEDLPRYTDMLKEKDKLIVLKGTYDWCELCKKLHKGEEPKRREIKRSTHSNGVCWPPKL